MDWDAERYRTNFSFVAAHGRGLVDDLDPQPGERVLDLGCGTGELTQSIAERGATVVGVDADAAMIAVARVRAPGAEVVLGDAHALPCAGPFDAVFSNAMLHWATEPDAVLAEVRRVLRPGGRFVAEQGGAGNTSAVLAAFDAACRAHGCATPELPWDFPSPAAAAVRLETAGFAIRHIGSFDRPTPLPPDAGGASGWLRMFGAGMLAELPEGGRASVLDDVDKLVAPRLQRPDGSWFIDYVRLRFVAEAL